MADGAKDFAVLFMFFLCMVDAFPECMVCHRRDGRRLIPVRPAAPMTRRPVADRKNISSYIGDFSGQKRENHGNFRVLRKQTKNIISRSIKIFH
jgi:hypothetical protein